MNGKFLTNRGALKIKHLFHGIFAECSVSARPQFILLGIGKVGIPRKPMIAVNIAM
jgi:hypothetical protein